MSSSGCEVGYCVECFSCLSQVGEKEGREGRLVGFERDSVCLAVFWDGDSG